MDTILECVSYGLWVVTTYWLMTESWVFIIPWIISTDLVWFLIIKRVNKGVDK